MAFDAGTIIAHLDLDEKTADAKLKEFERRVDDASRQNRFIKLGISSQDSSQLRREMEQLDRQLTNDAIRRSNSGQGSILATLLGMSSPSAARAQATQQQQAQKSVISRLLGGIGGGGGGGGRIHLNLGGGGSNNQGLGSGLFKGIGPGILGLGTRASLIAGLGGVGLGALPALVGGLAPLGVAGLGAGIIGLGAQQLIGTKNQRGQPATQGPLYNQATAAMSAVKKAFQAGASGLTKPLEQAFSALPKMISQLGPVLHNVFAGAGTLIMPVLNALDSVAKTTLPLLASAFRATAPLIGPLIKGIGGLVTGILPGLISLLRAASPAVHALAGLLGTLGSGIGRMLTDFAPAIKSSSVILTALGKVLGGLFPIIGQLSGVLARTLAPIFTQLAMVIKSLEPILLIIGKVFAQLASAILGDLVSAFSAFAKLIIGIRPAIQIFATALSSVFKVLENSGVFAVLGDALEKIVPSLAKLINLVAAQLAPILPVVIGLLAQFANIMITLLAAGLTTILTGITDLLKKFPFLVPLLGAATAAWWLFNAALDANPIGAVILAVIALVGIITELVKHWHTVWSDIKTVAADAWNFVYNGFGKYLLPLLGPAGLIALGAIELAKHWGTVCGDIKQAAHDLWQWLWTDFGQKIEQFFTQTIPSWWDSFINATKNRLIDPFKNGLGDMLSWVRNNIVQPLDNFFTQTIPNTLRDFITTAGNIMQRIEGVMKAPVAWVVDHVINGLISAFDWISGKVGGPHINPVHPMGLARGGKIASGTTETADDVLIRVSKGETVLSGMHSRMLAPLLGMVGVPGYASGGRIGQPAPHPHHGNPHLPQGQADPGGGIGSTITGFLHKAADLGKIMAAIATGNTKALTNAIVNLIPGGAGGAVADMAQLLLDVPKTLIKDAVQALIGLGGSANGSEIVSYAMRWLGKIPYVWGGTAVPGGADCSGFVQAVYQHFGIPAPRTSEAQGAWVRRGPPTPGGLAFYHSPPGGPDPGHVAIVRSPTQVISQGGGMGPQLEPLHFLPLLWTGTPPGGLGGTIKGAMSKTAVEQVWEAAGGPRGVADIAQAITGAESGRRPGAVQQGQPYATTGWGLWQITPGNSEPQFGINAALLTPINNARAAVAKYHGAGSRFTPWTTYNDGAYARWLDLGGWLAPGATMTLNGTGAREAVLTPSQSTAMVTLAEALRVAQANSGPSSTTGIEAKLERVITAIKQSSASTGSAVGDAINGSTRSSFYRANYSARGV